MINSCRYDAWIPLEISPRKGRLSDYTDCREMRLGRWSREVALHLRSPVSYTWGWDTCWPAHGVWETWRGRMVVRLSGACCQIELLSRLVRPPYCLRADCWDNRPVVRSPATGDCRMPAYATFGWLWRSCTVVDGSGSWRLSRASCRTVWWCAAETIE